MPEITFLQILPYLFAATLGYLSGSVPYGLIFAKFFCGIDPRLAGSGNVGSTNIARLCGKKWGFFTLVCDALKGILPIIAIQLFYKSTVAHQSLEFYGLTAGACAIIGHMFPLFLKGKGGKGVATTVGVFLALAPLELVAAGFVCLAVIWRTGFVSAGSLVLSVLLPSFLFYSGKIPTACLATAISLCIIMAHRTNIQRLLQGTEKPWTTPKKNK